MQPIITSILDSDLYKFTQQWFVLQTYPEVEVTYAFNNRNKNMKFTIEAIIEIQNQVEMMGDIGLDPFEYSWIRENLPFLPVAYVDFLSVFRFNPAEVQIWLDDDSQLQITITGKWRNTILWEVPLMAIISEVYFKMIDTDWNMENQDKLILKKGEALSTDECIFADFGTRRRRNKETQSIVVEKLAEFTDLGFVGTSNPHLAMTTGTKALGSVAHESIMATTVLESLNHPNKYFMENWTKVYKGDLGIMLPDTYGIDSFLKDFTLEKALLFTGVRHDSGDYKVFTDKVVAHYKKLRINPQTKSIIFSDGLDVKTALEINEYCDGRIKCSFGIGTFLTNDFLKASDNTFNSKPLNMVIKLKEVEGVPVVKLSDSPGKAIGDPDAVRVANWIHFGKKL